VLRNRREADASRSAGRSSNNLKRRERISSVSFTSSAFITGHVAHHLNVLLDPDQLGNRALLEHPTMLAGLDWPSALLTPCYDPVDQSLLFVLR
jgi:hypothetical protein